MYFNEVFNQPKTVSVNKKLILHMEEHYQNPTYIRLDSDIYQNPIKT